MATVEVLDTDITTLAVDAIANAANTQLMHCLLYTSDAADD